MRDPNKIFRDAVKSSLDGVLFFELSPVQVFDEKAEEGNNMTYVILSTQTSAQEPNFSGFGHQCSLLLDIVCKQYDMMNKEAVDDVSNQILTILFPSVSTNGLTIQSGFQINCLTVESVNYVPLRLANAKSIIRKLIRLTAKISQS